MFSIFAAFTHFSGCSLLSSSLTFCIHGISHCCQVGKKLDKVAANPVWAVPENPQSEQWNTTSWKSPCLAPLLSWIYWLLASNLPARFTCTNAFKTLCVSSLPSPRSSAFSSFQWFLPHFQKPSQLRRPLRCWKVTFCRLVWDVTPITHVLACPAGRVTLSPTCGRCWVNPALDGAQDRALEEGTVDASST